MHANAAFPVDVLEEWDEVFLGSKDADGRPSGRQFTHDGHGWHLQCGSVRACPLSSRASHLAMQLKDQTHLLHSCKNGIIVLVALHTAMAASDGHIQGAGAFPLPSIAVGRHSFWVALNTDAASLLR